MSTSSGEMMLTMILQFLRSKQNFDLMRLGGLGFSGMSNGVQGLLFKLGVAIRKATWLAMIHHNN